MPSNNKKIHAFIQKITAQLTILKKQDLEQFSNRAVNLEKNLVLFGQQIIRSGLVGITSSGKSALLNTLLGTGTEILKEQSKATTNMIVFCSKSKQPELEIYFNDGETKKKRERKFFLSQSGSTPLKMKTPRTNTTSNSLSCRYLPSCSKKDLK